VDNKLYNVPFTLKYRFTCPNMANKQTNSINNLGGLKYPITPPIYVLLNSKKVQRTRMYVYFYFDKCDVLAISNLMCSKIIFLFTVHCSMYN
jgi:hypothetical protein